MSNADRLFEYVEAEEHVDLSELTKGAVLPKELVPFSEGEERVCNYPGSCEALRAMAENDEWDTLRLTATWERLEILAKEVLPKTQRLKRLDLKGTDLYYRNGEVATLKAFAKALASNTSIEMLSIDDDISKHFHRILFEEGLRHNQSIRELDLDACLSKEDARALASVLSSSTSGIKKATFYLNHGNTPAFCDDEEEGGVMEALHISATSRGGDPWPQDVAAIALVRAKHISFIKLDVSKLERLSDTLESLEFAHSRINFEALISSCPKLERLCLNWTLDNGSAAQWHRFFEAHPALTSLEILCKRGVNFSDFALPQRNGLRQLIIHGGDANNVRLAALIPALSNLEHLELSGFTMNSSSSSIVELAKALLERSPALKYLELSHAQLDDESARVLACLIEHHKALESLVINDNRIGNRGIYHIAKALCYNPTSLHTLDVSHNDIVSIGCLQTALGVNLKLERINVAHNKIRRIAPFLRFAMGRLQEVHVAGNRPRTKAKQVVVDGTVVHTEEYEYTQLLQKRKR